MGSRIIVFKADELIVERLDELAARTGRTRSELIREAIRQYLARNDNPRTRRLRLYK